MTSHDEQRLSDALRRRAESADPTLLTLDDVTSRAGSIRRRRIASAVVAAAAVVAVVVPTGLMAVDRSNSTEPPVATQTPDSTPSVTDPTEEPTPDDRATPSGRLVTVPIGGDLPAGDAPRIPISVQGIVLTPDGTRIEFGEDLTYFAQVGEDYAGIVRKPGTEQAEFQVRRTDGSVVTSAPANNDGALVVTPDRTAVAYVGADQQIHTWTPTDGDLTFSEKLPDIQLTGITNTEPGTCKEPAPEGPGCTVVFSGGDGGAGYAASHGNVEEISGFTSLSDGNDGVIAGQTLYEVEKACYEVRLGPTGRPLWETCDASPETLSPSNEYVTALPAYYDGMCCSVYSVFDVAAGKKLLDVEVESTDQRPGYIPLMGWEDETHVLAVAFTGDEWRVVRVGLDGRAELTDLGRMGDLPTVDLGEVPIRLDAGA